MAASRAPSLPAVYVAKRSAARKHIEEIRRTKFSIGAPEPNPLMEDLHYAIRNLSAELYTKDVHFVMELIQNAEDNEYPAGVEPSLEFVITPRDVTGTGAVATLLVFNNEVGFSRRNVESICSVGRSTKRGRRMEGYIGEKGIGFKSVFLVCRHAYIFSNGYQIKFQEELNNDCGIGFTVPEWVNEKPSLLDIQREYSSNILPTTTIILPLRVEKIESVKKQLSEVHSEILLFLSKIKHLSIRKNATAQLLAESEFKIPVCSDAATREAQNAESHNINLSAQTEVVLITTEAKNAVSCIICLSAQTGHDGTEHQCRYYMWKQTFPVKSENVVDARKDVTKLVISLAFPLGQRLQRGSACSSIYAFLPTSMVTNFPFIIHADFILASSRETILLDNKWNLGILGTVPVAFTNAFLSCHASKNVKAISSVFDFLPTHASYILELENVRSSIQDLVREEHILPCEPLSNAQTHFSEPSKTVKLLPSFLDLLDQMKEKGLSLTDFLREGTFILGRSFCHERYDDAMKFLGVDYVSSDWYLDHIDHSDLLLQVSDDVYLDILRFVSCKLEASFSKLEHIHLLKHVTADGQMCLCSISQAKRKVKNICFVSDTRYAQFLSKWNMELGCPKSHFFLPVHMQISLIESDDGLSLRRWLTHMGGVRQVSLCQYIQRILPLLSQKKDPKHVILFTHFLYHCHLKRFISVADTSEVFCQIPVIDKSGQVRLDKQLTLPPSSHSRWSKLLGPDPFEEERYIELGEVYVKDATFEHEYTTGKAFLKFVIMYLKADDLPKLQPPDAPLPSASSQLTEEQATLLLSWIRNLKAEGIEFPSKFIESVKCGKWVKTTSGFNSPSQCILLDENEEDILSKVGSLLNCFAVLDEKYYNHRVRLYGDELKMLGVRFGSLGAWKLIVDHLESLSSSEITGETTISLLEFVRYTKQCSMLDIDLLKKLMKGSWLKTSQGYKSPEGSVLVKQDTMAASQISTLPIIDEAYYGGEVLHYVAELKLLGVVVDEDQRLYECIVGSFKFPENLSDMSKESVFMILGCIRNLGLSNVSFIENIKDKPWLKTNLGFRCPSESLLYNPTMDCILSIIEVPLIDENFYGIGIQNFFNELGAIGVALDFPGAIKRVAFCFKAASSLPSLTRDNVISLLKCIRSLGTTTPLLLTEFKSCLSGETWLKTRHDYQLSLNSILFDSKWGTISQFVDLPIIDDTFYGIGIYDYRKELKLLDVILDFREGHRFVATGLSFPNHETIGAEGTYSLLQCIGHMMENSLDGALPPDFVRTISENKWLKTHMGYRSPEDSLLFDPDWSSVIEAGDGPFIDEIFYGAKISSYCDILQAIGVKSDVNQACLQICKVLTSLSSDPAIIRLYQFLNKFEWKPVCDESNSNVWIPRQDGTCGKWVSSSTCVLHDPYSLFSSQLHILDKYYEEELLNIFSCVFGVAEIPSFQYYFDLWKEWQSNDQCQMTSRECSSLWRYLLTNWDTEEILKMGIMKLPSCITPDGRIRMMEKSRLFIPDNLELEKLFVETCTGPLFVWYPLDEATIYLNKFHGICDCLGVRKLSESVKMTRDTYLSSDDSEKLNVVDGLISKVLIKLMVAFLSVSLEMGVRERRHAVTALLDLKIYEVPKPVVVQYELPLPHAGKRLVATTSRAVLLAGSDCLLVCLPNWEDKKESIEFVTCFAQAISEKILGKNRKLVNDLCRIIEIGFWFTVNDHTLSVLLRTQNLIISPEDEDFIDGKFPSDQLCTPWTQRKKMPRRWDEGFPSPPGFKKMYQIRPSDACNQTAALPSCSGES